MIPRGGEARRAVINDIEKESRDKTGLRSDVIPFYNGGHTTSTITSATPMCGWCSHRKKPVAFFGGDPDNFEYPRYDLDICFFRVYENGQAVHVNISLKWGERGRGRNLIFVSGNPGRTERLDTMAHIEYQRDLVVPGRSISCAGERCS